MLLVPTILPGTTSKDWIYMVCLWSMIVSLCLQSLPQVRRRRQLVMRTGPLFVMAVMALLVAFIYDSDEAVNLPCTIIAVGLILLNDWLPVIFTRRR